VTIAKRLLSDLNNIRPYSIHVDQIRQATGEGMQNRAAAARIAAHAIAAS
jgi:hypothetical protein